jgi:hypothetical protein
MTGTIQLGIDWDGFWTVSLVRRYGTGVVTHG